MHNPNKIQAALLLDARFDGLDMVAREFARVAEMKFGVPSSVSEQNAGQFLRLQAGDQGPALTFEYVNAPPQMALFTDALASPVTTLLSPDMQARVSRAAFHIVLEASLSELPELDAHPALASAVDELGTNQPSQGHEAFNRRLETLALMARIASDHAQVAAIHWTQSNQLFTPDSFEALAQSGFPGPIAIHPLLFGELGDSAAPANPPSIGFRTFGARHWLGREIVVPPTALPWDAAYDAALAFIAYAALPGGATIPDGDTFSPPPAEDDAQSGQERAEIWRVRHRDDPASSAHNDDGDASGGSVPITELIPLRRDACGFLAHDYTASANVLAQRGPRASKDPLSEAEATLAELKAALEEGRAQAAANPPEPLAASPIGGTPSLAGETEVSGRSLRAKVFGKKQP